MRSFWRVGDIGFEPTTSRSQTVRASQLRQSPSVPLAGIGPTRFLRPQDFKSCVYTNFTTAALEVFYNIFARIGDTAGLVNRYNFTFPK